MKPILLNGHTRSLTKIKYNREGDLLFSVSKDQSPNVWYSHNGERLGTYDGHTGTVWCVDISYDSKVLLTGSADNSAKIWDVYSGKLLHSLETNTSVRTCGFSHYVSDTIFYTTDSRMGFPCLLIIKKLGADGGIEDVCETSMETLKMAKITSAVWGPYNEFIVTGHEDGTLAQWDPMTGDMLRKSREHRGAINDIQLAPDHTMFISASKDCTAKLFDVTTFKHLKTYKTERPVNAAAIAPDRDNIVLGGGQEAANVTTTSVRVGKFDARFYHMVFEEEIGRVKGHFGPINTVAFHPDGKSYASGGEDGYVRINKFDESYFLFEFPY